MPPNPPTKAHGFAMRSMSLCDMQISKSEKKILGPPLPNPGDAPVSRAAGRIQQWAPQGRGRGLDVALAPLKNQTILHVRAFLLLISPYES